MRKYIFAFLLVFFAFVIKTRSNNYQMLDNYHLDFEANSVRSFVQDAQGLMWIGTNNGLYSFDGYKAYLHKIPGNGSMNIIHCSILYQEHYLLLGSEAGILLYNIQKDKFEPFIPEFENDVRSLVLVENELWIGCSYGLYKYDFNTEKIIELLINRPQDRKHNMVYTLLKDDAYVYLGSNGAFGRYSIKNYQYEMLDTEKKGGGFLLNSLLKDDKRKCIWVGQGSNLFKYHLDQKKLENVGDFFVVKSMTLDHENNIIMGTDNGLNIYNEKGTKHIVHDSRESKSLANNIIWCVYNDQNENIWLGTDYGISVSAKFRRFNYKPISKITGSGEGNQFYHIYHDAFNNYWLGGTNGLILSENTIGQKTKTRWFKMGGSPYSISHSHIRDVFEDRDKNLWVATDYGINRYNYQSSSFTRYAIYEPNGTRNTNWAYDIQEDSKNRLWVASFNGGIFVIDKKKLLSTPAPHTADVFYSKKNGLSGNNVYYIVFDNQDNVWALVNYIGIDVIDQETGKISSFPIEEYTGGAVPDYLLGDSQGFIWAGYTNGVVRIDPLNRTAINISFKGTNNAGILAMAEVKSSIYISTTDGIWIVNKQDLTTRQMNTVNHVFTGMYYDKSEDMVVLGGNDGVALLNPNAKVDTSSEKIMISAIYINNQPYANNPNSLAVRYLDEINLAHNQNTIRIEFSDLTYSEEKREPFIYKLSEDIKWTTLASGENSIQIDKLTPGTYDLLIGKLSGKGELNRFVKKLTIEIAPPWYGTLFAKIIYSLFIFSFIWWVYFFITSKNRMRYERMEKETSLEQSKLKIAFFTNVAHEFKTPLSLIIAPLSGLIHGTKNDEDRNALEMVHQNAMKLNSLIHQAIDYYRDDSKVNIGLLLSKVELVEFARSIFMAYKEGMKDRQIEFIFNTNVDRVYLNIDTVKIESIFNNLLSNACKFTNTGDSIILSLEYTPRDNGVEIKVSDSGVGIPKQDIPYIFQRFFQSNANSKGREGTGIGLFLVKNYVELHGGTVDVISEMAEGTNFVVWLPVIVSDLEVLPVHNTLFSDSEDKQLIVIVEDSVAIAEFIYNIFISEYRCIIAHNGKTGLKACMELKPDIIISDVMMPIMDGLEMAQRLKENPQTAAIPLVFLTAKDDKETELKSIQLNIDAFIAKPFDSIILYSRVKQLLENRKLLEKKARIENLSTPKANKIESIDEKFLAQITKIIEDKIADPGLNVNMLCELANSSPKQLYRKVKQLTGMTAVNYIKSIRMKKAAMFLSNKNFTIAEVMYMVGFSNHSYFAKCFQATFGKTPRQFVEQKKEA